MRKTLLWLLCLVWAFNLLLAWRTGQAALERAGCCVREPGLAGGRGAPGLAWDLSSKGNGALWIGRRLIRVYDTHDDCVIFRGETLSITVVPGFGELWVWVWGRALLSSDKGAPLGEEPVVGLYRWTKLGCSVVQERCPEATWLSSEW